MKATGCKKIYNAENIIEAEMLESMPDGKCLLSSTASPWIIRWYI